MDPGVPTRLRYWDGNGWTPYTSAPPISGTLVIPSGTGLELAGWWRRAGGLLLDNVIIVVSTFAIGAVLGLIFYANALAFILANNPYSAGPAARFLFLAAEAAIGIAYAVWFLGHRSRTPGMSAVGITAVDRSGATLSRAQAWKRAFTVFALVGIWIQIANLIKVVHKTPHGHIGIGGIFELLYVAGLLTTYLWPLGNSLNQTLQDRAVGSIVVIGSRQSPTE